MHQWTPVDLQISATNAVCATAWGPPCRYLVFPSISLHPSSFPFIAPSLIAFYPQDEDPLPPRPRHQRCYLQVPIVRNLQTPNISPPHPHRIRLPRRPIPLLPSPRRRPLLPPSLLHLLARKHRPRHPRDHHLAQQDHHRTRTLRRSHDVQPRVCIRRESPVFTGVGTSASTKQHRASKPLLRRDLHLRRTSASNPLRGSRLRSPRVNLHSRRPKPQQTRRGSQHRQSPRAGLAALEQQVPWGRERGGRGADTGRVRVVWGSQDPDPHGACVRGQGPAV